MVDVQNNTEEKNLTPEELIEKLKSALQKDGDFPATAKIVTDLRRLAAEPKTTANQVTEVILKEPSLATRILHLVNSSFYRRVKPIMTVSQAVVQIGMKQIAEMCAGLVLLQRFVPAARRGGVFASCLQKTIVTSLLSGALGNSITNQGKDTNNERGYLAGSFVELGTLLLAYYFPHIYDNAVKRANTKNQSVSKSLKEITGITPAQLSIHVLKALELPDFYQEIIKATDENGKVSTAIPTAESTEIQNSAKALQAAESISDVVVFSKNKLKMDFVLDKIKQDTGINAQVLNAVVGNLPKMFSDHCSMIELNLSALPEFISAYATEGNAEKKSAESDPFNQYVAEIKQAIEAREPTSSVITTVMETFAWGLKFDRVLLLLVNVGKKSLTGRMILGETGSLNPKDISRPLGREAHPQAPDAKAFVDGHAAFFGLPILKDGWPLVAVPVGVGSRCIGVIYADRKSADNNGEDAPELTDREKASIGVLTDLLDRSISGNSTN